ncbi:uncharacterized protein LOC132556481, partial [Ylistrum balloti]|uniref:uncharacterized protein LOC132556481 n=1 Tax=Ylistrum balloti TaxID=509963 RepID=UPI002905F56A
EFFERKKFNAKTAHRHKVTTSSRKHSEDLKAIQTISSIHSDTFTFQQPRRPLKVLDLDKFRSKSSMFRPDLDLGPSSPIKTPSKLQRLEASHHKQVDRKVKSSQDDGDLFFPKPSQKYSRLGASDESHHLSTQFKYSQSKFKIPDVPRRSQTTSTEGDLIDNERKIWNRKLTDEMFKHSRLPNKKHKITFEPYRQSYCSTKDKNFTTDLLGMNLTQDQSKVSGDPGTYVPAHVVPFVSKSTPVNPLGKNMFITEDFQMTPVRKYRSEENRISKLGLGHLRENIELSDMSDVERLPNIDSKLRSNVFQGEDFIQTPLVDELSSDDLPFQTPPKLKFYSSQYPVKEKDEVKDQTRYLEEANFQTPSHKFTPRMQLQSVVNHDKPSVQQDTDWAPNRMHMLPSSQESFLTTFNDFRGSTIHQRFKMEHASISETASFPETTSNQYSPKESASISIVENQTEKEEEVDKKQFTKQGNGMMEILDEMHELEKQDKMDEWMLVDEFDIQHEEESRTHQVEEEVLFPSEDEEVKNAMNDILTRVVENCSYDFEYDRYNPQTELNCSQPPVEGSDNTLKESHSEVPEKHILKSDDSKEIKVSESSSRTESHFNIGETRYCDASTSTIENETCEKATQYSPRINNAPDSLQRILSSSQCHRQFSVKPIKLRHENVEREESVLESGKNNINEVENAYCLRSRKRT